jgi:hypothetical protein
MVRTVKTKAVRSLKKGERAVVFPGPTGAEPWEIWILGDQADAECVQTCARPSLSRARKNTTFALPASEVFCLPLWLNETDPKLFAGMIPLQLELRGLQPRGGEAAVFDCSVVAQEETRTLVVIGVLPGNLSPALEAETFEAFDLSLRFLPLPEDALTLWREQDHLVLAVTRGPNLVYFQGLTEGQLSSRVLQDLTCILATLEMERMVTSLREVWLWAEVTPAEVAALETTLRLPVCQGPRPAPQSPSSVWKLVPATVGEAKRTRERQRWRNRGLWLAVAIYLLVVAGLLLRWLVLSRQVDELRQWQAAHAQAVTSIHETETAWRELAPVVDENSYPLELLLHTCDSIPADAMHLTLFETSNGHLLIKAEANNASAAFQFMDHLKADPHFSGYTWTMGQPQILPNDLTQLQIEGTNAN